jgi:hypothetical protein
MHAGRDGGSAEAIGSRNNYSQHQCSQQVCFLVLLHYICDLNTGVGFSQPATLALQLMLAVSGSFLHGCGVCTCAVQKQGGGLKFGNSGGNFFTAVRLGFECIPACFCGTARMYSACLQPAVSSPPSPHTSSLARIMMKGCPWLEGICDLSNLRDPCHLRYVCIRQ